MTQEETVNETRKLRVRAVQFVIQPVLVADDGETLTPIQVDQIVVPAGEVDSWVSDGLPRQIDGLTAQLNEPPAER